MTGNDLYERVKIIFGAFMVFFYIGLGLFFIFAPLFDYVNIVLRTVFGSAMALYGLARAHRTYEQVRELFFTARESEKEKERIK